MPKVKEVDYKPNLTKCQKCIFLGVAFNVRCLRESPGEKTIREAVSLIPELKIPKNPFPQCQDEMNAR